MNSRKVCAFGTLSISLTMYVYGATIVATKPMLYQWIEHRLSRQASVDSLPTNSVKFGILFKHKHMYTHKQTHDTQTTHKQAHDTQTNACT